MLTCSSCCVTANFYDFFNFGKFVKIRDFFAEVTNSQSMVVNRIFHHVHVHKWESLGD